MKGRCREKEESRELALRSHGVACLKCRMSNEPEIRTAKVAFLQSTGPSDLSQGEAEIQLVVWTVTALLLRQPDSPYSYEINYPHYNEPLGSMPLEIASQR